MTEWKVSVVMCDKIVSAKMKGKVSAELEVAEPRMLRFSFGVTKMARMDLMEIHW